VQTVVFNFLEILTTDRMLVILCSISYKHTTDGQGPALAIALLTQDELKTRSALQSCQWQLIWHELMIPQHTMRPFTARLS